uniref:Uncharacterized protein n=1 Tax=Romanomermis culicivorax TaxID=13658 RepID=A0A915L8L7_ROMCU
MEIYKLKCKVEHITPRSKM